MKTIWKYPLDVTDLQTVSIPVGAQLLTVQMQGRGPCLWALVDPDAETEPRRIAIHGTGHLFTELAGNYIATFQMYGPLVFHVFLVS